MLENILGALDRLSANDDAIVRIEVVSRATGTTRVQLLLSSESSDSAERWHVTAGCVLASVFRFSVAPSILHTHDHPEALACNQPTFELYFRGTGIGPAAAIGALFAAHQAVRAPRTPFERFFNMPQRLPLLLASGAGLLAAGPEVYLRAYAQCLNESGISPQVRHARAPLHPAASALVVGESHVVAESFEAQFLEVLGAA